MLDRFLHEIQKPDIIFFPKEELKDIKQRIKNGEEISTVRNSCGNKEKVFKTGQTYRTTWGIEIEITKVKNFTNPEKIPTWNKMNKTMKNSIYYGIKMCGTDNLQWVHLRKVKSSNILYHGSSKQGMTVLDPSFNLLKHDITAKENFLYAATTKKIASAFTFFWYDAMGIKFEGINNVYTMRIPSKLLHLIKKPCSIYTISREGFTLPNSKFKGEMITTKRVKVLDEEKYKTAEECMIRNGIKIEEYN